ncbi:MAG TPA: sigma-70 family RNA polymerase sigma factor [Thermoleophilaceae bacterium]|nr:sigma-70 family RNA polymerase sigma factor [Thermoleophilaceae bacterium]
MGNDAAEARFRTVFTHLGAVTAYARRRGSPDPEGIGAEVMTIAWRRLAVVPRGDPRPWLYATARNLVWAEARRAGRAAEHLHQREPVAAPELLELDPELAGALRSLSASDREALLLVAWEDLTPSQAAKALGIKPAAFRVRLLRARRRLAARLAESPAGGPALALVEMEEA